MKRLEKLFDGMRPRFEEGGRFEKLWPLFEAIETFALWTGRKTGTAPHVRDAIDLKRVMTTVIVALLPCIFMALWNTGLQANLALQASGQEALGWRATIFGVIAGQDPNSFWDNLVHGASYFLPAYIVTMTVGLGWEVIFAIIRRHEVSEGFLVSGLLIPLTLPPGTPLWQIAVGTSFGVVIGKELFGGTGRNFLNPALTTRAFLYFAYPAELSGDSVWTAVDGYTRATPLTSVPVGGVATIDVSWTEAFLGTTPGSMGETSILACLFGAVILVASGIGSWRIMLPMLLGGIVTAVLFNAIGSDTNPMFEMGPHWHLVTGGFAFGLVFMATDPVSAAQTHMGQWIYGAMCGVLSILIRVVNPAYPEGVMLAILLGNVFAPLIDYFVVQANVRRRQARYGI